MKHLPTKSVWLASALAVVGLFSAPDVPAAPAKISRDATGATVETCAAKSARKNARKDRKSKKAAKKKRHHQKKKSAKA